MATPSRGLLGERLVAHGALSRRHLRSALARQRSDPARLGELLVAEGWAEEDEVWSELAASWDLPLVRVEPGDVDPDCCRGLALDQAVALEVLPLRRYQGALWVAASDPRQARVRALVSRLSRDPVRWVTMPPSRLRRLQLQLWGRELAGAACHLTEAYDRGASAARLLSRWQLALGLALAAGLTWGLVRWTALTLTVAMGVVTLAYAVAALFRTRVVVRGARAGAGEPVAAEELEGLGKLPTYTVLCPLYHEAAIVPQLLQQLAQLDYPKAKLDVKLLLEADDTETRNCLGALSLPRFCEVVTVPDVGPRTKPKACNYGLLLARGQYVVIFDAEDRPEPDQLKKALAVFHRHLRRGDDRLGCVQAQLGFHNWAQNWLTGWFALEYLSFFRYFLPGLVSLGLPVPLGGTSNHFPTALLRALGAWDAFNVTEDADLGVRLHRAGFRTVIVDSVTWEEANSEFVNWTKQRSRWGKGYFVTWLVNMRHPWRLWRELGTRGWVSIQVTLLGTYLSALLNLLLWGLIVVWLVGQPPAVGALFPPETYYLAMLELLLGNFFFLYVTLWCAVQSGSYRLARLALVYPVYWVMISLAMTKALVQLATDHVYWEKTTHGLAQAEAPRGAARLTASPGRPEA